MLESAAVYGAKHAPYGIILREFLGTSAASP